MAEPLEDPRLQPLLRELQVDYATPFVAPGAADQQIELAHYKAGRDASYVFVSRTASGQDSSAVPNSVTIDPKNISGTTIIYDVTAEALQGKSRPFACDLGEGGHVYAILPCQIEEIDLRVEKNNFGDVRVHVAFLDASGGRLEAAMPFARWLTDSRGSKHRETFWTTDRAGTSSQWFRWGKGHSGKSWTVTVRSLLTGRTKSAQFEKQV